MTTTTKTDTVAEVLAKANPNQIADALRKVNLGNLLQVKEYDTGAITASASISLPEKALAVLSAHVVSSGTPAAVGHYMAGNSSTTPLLPPGGANAGVGLCSVQGISAPGAGNTASGYITGVTFPNTVTRVVIRYIPAPAVAMTDKFAS